MTTITVIFDQAVIFMTILISFCYSQTRTLSGIKLLGQQDRAIIDNSDAVHYSMVSKIECALQCASAVACCGISYRKDSSVCSLGFFSICGTVYEEGSVFMRNPLSVPVCSDCLVFGSSTYTISSTVADWETSRVSCINIGGKLAEIETQEENDFLKSSLNIGSSYWIGGYDLKWISKPNEQMIYTDWADVYIMGTHIVEPDKTDTQRCLILWKSFSLSWGTYICSNTHKFICEFE